MFTVCPKCALTLVVTAEDLRVAQGYVRCGRCSSVFNALARLTEERLPEAPLPSPPPSAPREAAAPAAPLRPRHEEPERPALAPSGLDDDAIPEDDVIPEDALEFDPAKTDVSSVFIEPPPDPQWTAATGTFKAMLAANQEVAQAADEPSQAATPPTPGHEGPPPADEDADIDVELDPDLLASILHADAAHPPDPPAGVSPAPPAARASAAAVVPERSAAQPHEGARVEPPKSEPPRPAPPPAPAPPAVARPRPTPPPPPPPPPAAPPSGIEASLERPTRLLRNRREVSAPREGAKAPAAEGAWRARVLPYAWTAGAVLALLTLCAQIVNHYRDDLAANARFNRPLTSLYAALGVQLAPRWDLRAYDVRQLGASVDPGTTGLITVRASIKNGAPQAQPLPLLRVTLQDRFGNRIAARDVAPPSYLPHPAPAAKFLSAGQRIDAEMGFVDPGANAVGFEIDACLPTAGGEVTCANDLTVR